MTRWLRRIYLRTCSELQLREQRAGLLTAKRVLVEGAVCRTGMRLTAGEELEQARLSGQLELIDLELQRRGLAPWR